MGTNERRRPGSSDRPSWPAEPSTDLRTLPSYWPERMTEAVLAEANDLAWAPPGDAEPLWERWFQRALEEGVDEDLASLGRSLIHECSERGWNGELRAECGWLDDGEDMLELALVAPEEAGARWRQLLDRDEA